MAVGRAGYFYPRSPCGERRQDTQTCRAEISISIHALLAESDCVEEVSGDTWTRDFYPRSPCGERLNRGPYHVKRHEISIHALLAESDGGAQSSCFAKIIFLSTLSLRRATEKVPADVFYQAFLSTLSLRRATGPWFARLASCSYFYPRSPCGERLCNADCNYRSGHHFYPRSPCGERPGLRFCFF